MAKINIIRRILAEKSNREKVEVGEEVNVKVDLAIAHDVTGPMAVSQFEKMGAKKVFDGDRVAFILDHNFPCSSVDTRKNHKILEDFAEKYSTKIYKNSEGVIHQVVWEEDLHKKGDIVVGADSHTCTAGARGAVAIPVGSTELAAAMALGELLVDVPETTLIEVNGKLKDNVYAKDIILHIIGKFGTNGFTDKAVVISGSTIFGLDDEEKMTIANMMIEMGTMIGYIADETDEIGEAEASYTIDAKDIDPVAACPSSPGNVKKISDIKGVKINQAVIGSCTNGRISDMRIAASVVEGKKIAPKVNFIVVPASKNVLSQMEDEGLTQILRDAGAIIMNPGCGPCYGAHQGLLTSSDVAISSTNRNFPGRMGAKDAQIYLASPHVVAESAINGYITEPTKVEVEK